MPAAFDFVLQPTDNSQFPASHGYSIIITISNMNTKGSFRLIFAPLLAVVWAGVLFIATCTFDPPTVLVFKINAAPNFRDLLITSDIQPMDTGYLLSKLGHFSGFGLILLLLLNWLRNFRSAFIWCGSYAALTEILQLFFYRDGRFFDMGIDLAGMLFASILGKIIFKNLEKNQKSHQSGDSAA